VDRANLSLVMPRALSRRKGIGRLSGMRLGGRLWLRRACADTHLSVIDIDWSRFSDIDAMVDDIDLEVVRGAASSWAWTGTRLQLWLFGGLD